MELFSYVLQSAFILLIISDVKGSKEVNKPKTMSINGPTFGGNISCDQTDRILINSVNYYTQISESCDLKCPTLRKNPEYLVGANTVCSNENAIRSSCSARRSCQLSSLPLPNITCGTSNSDKVGKVKVYYQCVSEDLVINLCEERALLVEDERQVVLTTPLSSEESMSRSECECSLTSRHPGQPINSNVTLTRQRMAQLLEEHSLTYSYSTHSYDIAPTYVEAYPPTERVYAFGTYSGYNGSIQFENRGSQDKYSKVFLTLQPGKDLIIRCNGAKVTQSTVQPSQTTRTRSENVAGSSPSSNYLSTAFHLTATPSNSWSPAFFTKTPDTVYRTGSSITLPGTTLAEDGGSGVPVPIIIAVAVVVLVIAAVVAACFLYRRKRGRRAEKHAANISENNNVALAPLCPAETVPETDDTYHELEETNDYNEIDREPYSDADPYKVTLLRSVTPPSGHLYNGTRTNTASGVRNSRGSIDSVTENSTVIENEYSEACDVLPASAGANASETRQYDVPAEVDYATINKPLRNADSVELIDNELYVPYVSPEGTAAS